LLLSGISSGRNRFRNDDRLLSFIWYTTILGRATAGTVHLVTA
jgi:hypothetical protein